MAKRAPTTSATEAAAAAEVPVIDVPAGGTLEVIVDVGPMTIPYTVAYAGNTVIKSLVDRAEMVTLLTGGNILAWAFAHTQKKWSHKIGVSVNGGAMTVLEEKSEAKKDTDHSIGFALVNFAGGEP